MCTRASCNLRLLSVPSYRLSRVNGGRVEYTLHHGISQRECLRPAPCQPAHPLSLHLHRLYRAPRGRPLIYLKDEVDAKLPASSLPAKVARFSRLGFHFNFYFRFLSFCDSFSVHVYVDLFF